MNNPAPGQREKFVKGEKIVCVDTEGAPPGIDLGVEYEVEDVQTRIDGEKMVKVGGTFWLTSRFIRAPAPQPAPVAVSEGGEQPEYLKRMISRCVKWQCRCTPTTRVPVVGDKLECIYEHPDCQIGMLYPVLEVNMNMPRFLDDRGCNRDLAWPHTNFRIWQHCVCGAGIAHLEQELSEAQSELTALRTRCEQAEQQLKASDGERRAVTGRLAHASTVASEQTVMIRELRSQLTASEAARKKAEGERDEMQEWRVREQRFLISVATRLLDAGYKGESTPDGIEWVISERDALQAELDELKSKR